MRSNFPPEAGRLADSSYSDCGLLSPVVTSSEEFFRLGGTTFRSGSKIADTGIEGSVVAAGKEVDADSVAISADFADADIFSREIVASAKLITSFGSSCFPFGFLLFGWPFD